MKKTLIGIVTVTLLTGSLFSETVDVNTIEQLDDLALFSFAVMGDNNGRAASTYNDNGDVNALGMSYLEPWIKNNDAFVLGVGDHAQGGRETWYKMTENDSYWHNNYYPVVGDNDNKTDYHYSSTGDDEAAWGRGWTMFEALNDFFDRDTAIDHIEFRQPQSSKVYSAGKYWDDQLCEYYATRTQGPFTFHIIGLNIPEPGQVTARSRDWMMDKLNTISAQGKTAYDIVIVNGQQAKWVKRGEDQGWFNSNVRDTIMTVADLVVCGDDHQYRRQNEYDHIYNGTGAIWMNSGQPCYNTGSARGYLDFHVFDNPPRFTAQYIVTEKKSWYTFDGTRKLQKGSYIKPNDLDDGLDPDDYKAYIKYVNGPYEVADWNNFEIDGAPPPPVDTTPPTVSFDTPSGNTSVDVDSTLYVNVSASDSDSGIDRVYLSKDGVELSRSEGGAPYEWNATGQSDAELQNLQEGSFALTARAVDNAGNEKTTSITITVGNAPSPTGNPTVAFNTPSGDVTLNEGDDLYLLVDASDSDGIDRVYLSKDGVSMRSEGGAPYEWNAPSQTNDTFLQNLPVGTFVLSARAVDLLGNENTASITVTVNTLSDSPSVSFIAPTDGIQINEGENLWVEVGASDSDGIDVIYLYKDGVQLAHSEGAAPYEWGSSNPELVDMAAGTYVITARAVDNLGNYSEASVTVIVNPVVVSGYDAWAATNTVGVAAADDDGDGRPNLLEYALGGNPEAAGDADPVLVKSGGGFEYRHFKRNDDPNLSCIVQICTDLASGVWTDVASTGEVTSTVGEYDEVTYTIPADQAQTYIRLKVMN